MVQKIFHIHTHCPRISSLFEIKFYQRFQRTVKVEKGRWVGGSVVEGITTMVGDTRPHSVGGSTTMRLRWVHGQAKGEESETVLENGLRPTLRVKHFTLFTKGFSRSNKNIF